MQNYNWKRHYAAQITMREEVAAFRHYRVENETGTGELIACAVFPGIQAVYNDLFLANCRRAVPQNEDVIEVTYCMEGRYECEVSDRYCFHIGHGDLSVGIAGRGEANGGFPSKRFSGLTLFLDLHAIQEQYGQVFQKLEIDLSAVQRLSIQRPRRFILHSNAEMNSIFFSAVSAMTEHRLPQLKIKILEALMLLSEPSLAAQDEPPTYLSQRYAKLARDVQRRVTSDLSCHFTMERLSTELHAAPTAIKAAFKSVYGESLRDYLKTYRMQEARRLLRETDKPIAEIAASVGFANSGHFATAFREKYGIKPGDYKKTVRLGRKD